MIDYLEQGRMINNAYYSGKLRQLSQKIARKRRGKLSRRVLLLQDNAIAYAPQVAMTAATQCGFEILPRSPYSTKLAPSDFHLFPKLKPHCRGTQYGSN